MGKTTTAAALGVALARAGRRVLVSTIDPAPRLMDALHIPELGSEPVGLPPAVAERLGITAGELRAVRLDTERAFSRLVEEEIPDPAGRARVFNNPIYGHITRNLTGALEHAAMLALDRLWRAGGFDFLILDTPPTANALDFVEAPRRLADAIGSPAVQWLTRPRKQGGLLSGGRLSMGSAFVLRRLAKFVGSQFLEDIGAFLVDFHDVLSGFLARAQRVDALLRSPAVGTLLVLVPEAPAVDEARLFYERLAGLGLHPSAFVVNRTLAEPPLADAATLHTHFARVPAFAMRNPADQERAIAELAPAVAVLASLARAQAAELERLAQAAPRVPIARVRLTADEAGSLGALVEAAQQLETALP